MLSLSLYPSERLSHQCVRKHTAEAAGNGQDTTEPRATAAAAQRTNEEERCTRASPAKHAKGVCPGAHAGGGEAASGPEGGAGTDHLKLQKINPFIPAAPIPGRRHTLVNIYHIFTPP